MSIFITCILTAISATTLILTLRKASQKTVDKTLKIFAIAFVVVCFFRIVKEKDVFDAVVALDVSAVPGVESLSKSQAVWFVLLRWLTQLSVVFGILAPFYKIKTVDNVVAFVLPVVTLLNIIFLPLNFTCFIGADNFFWADIRVIQFVLELALAGGLGAFYLYRKIANKDWENIGKQLLNVLIVSLLLLAVLMPSSSFTILFGDYQVDRQAYVMDTFDMQHRLLIYFTVAGSVAAYFLLRNKSREIRHFALTSVSLAGLIVFFYTYTLPFTITADGFEWKSISSVVTQLPLHLCNAGTILIFFSFAFNSKPLFYFNFLINVLGSAIALIACNTGGAFSGYVGIHYYYTHCFLCVLPCMGIALKIFDRPTFKMVRGAVLVFTIYFLIVCVLNPWFCNYAGDVEQYVADGSTPAIDYFYLMSDFISDKISFAEDLMKDYAYPLQIKGLTFWTYPVFWAGVYVVYVALTFGVWYVYKLMFKVGDHHYDMLVRKRRARADLLGIDKAHQINLENSSPLNPQGEKMLKFNHFTKVYGNAAVKAVDDFNLEIHDGEVFGFIGHNGAGKSTCIKSLVGIQSITEGSIEVCGFDIAKQPLPAKRLMGYVPDNHAVYERLTGREYINYVADLYRVSKQDREERLEKYLNLFKLKGDIDRQIKGYSHGMKQKVVVIAALIHQPKVWVLDEPLTGLDPTSSFQIKECMREHANKGNIVFFSSHIIEVVEKVCDRIAIISKGKLQCVHSIADLRKQNVSLEEIYLKYVQAVDKEFLDNDGGDTQKEAPCDEQNCQCQEGKEGN